jgi:hypothetical protein
VISLAVLVLVCVLPEVVVAVTLSDWLVVVS